jgi:hypothetical protein
VLARLLVVLAPPTAFVITGAALQALLPRPLERSIAARLGYAYLLGVAWIGLLAWSLGLLFGVPLGRTLFFGLVAAALLAGVAAVAARGGDLGGLAPRRRPGTGRRFRALLPAAALVVAASLALLADAAVSPVHDFDGRMTWGTQARYLRAAHGVLPAVLVDRRAYVLHPRYPILMPLAQVAAAELAETDLDGFAVRPLYVLFLPALAAILAPALLRLGGARSAGLVLTLTLSAPALLWNQEVGARGTYSDLPLAAFLGAGLLLLLDPRSRHDRWRGVAAGLLLAAAVGTKNEGMLLAPAVAVLTLGAALRPRAGARRARVSPAAAAGLAAVLVVGASILVAAWRLRIPNRNDEGYFEGFPLRALVSGFVARAPAAARTALLKSLDPSEWGGLFWVAPLLVVAGRRWMRRPEVLVALAVVGCQCALAASAYALVPNPGIVAVTWSRLMVQMLVPLAVVLTAATRAALAEARLRARPAPPVRV